MEDDCVLKSEGRVAKSKGRAEGYEVAGDVSGEEALKGEKSGRVNVTGREAQEQRQQEPVLHVNRHQSEYFNSSPR